MARLEESTFFMMSARREANLGKFAGVIAELTRARAAANKVMWYCAVELSDLIAEIEDIIGLVRAAGEVPADASKRIFDTHEKIYRRVMEKWASRT